MKIISKSDATKAKDLPSKPEPDDVFEEPELADEEPQGSIKYRIGNLTFGTYGSFSWWVAEDRKPRKDGKPHKDDMGDKYYYPDLLSVMKKGAVLLHAQAHNKKALATLEEHIREYRRATAQIAKALRGE